MFTLLALAISVKTNAGSAIPTELQSMSMLYGPAYTKRGSIIETIDEMGIRRNKDSGYHHTITEYVTPWKIATISLNGTAYFIATGQGYAVHNSQNSGSPAHVQSAYISAIWFVNHHGKWLIAGKAMNMGYGGAFGTMAGSPWTPFPQIMRLGQDFLLIADQNKDSHQGYQNQDLPLFLFTAHGLQSLGEFPNGADDTGALAKPETSFSGKIVSATYTMDGLPEFTVSYSGKTVLQGKPIVFRNVICEFTHRNISAGTDVWGVDRIKAEFKPAGTYCTKIFNSEFF